jgi:hypothetical protein
VKTKKAAFAAALGAVTAVSALLVGTTAAAAGEIAPSSAYGIAASGLFDLDPLPAVESTDGEEVSDELIGLGEGPVSARVLTAEASANAAESSVADLRVAGLLRAKLIRTHCADGEGGLQIVQGSLLGTPLPETAVPETEIDGSPLVSVVLNGQSRDDDGALTVTGIRLTVLPGAAGNLDAPLDAEDRQALPELGDLFGTEFSGPMQTVGDVVKELGGLDRVEALQTVVIGSATCSEGVEEDEEELPEAPKPEIVEADLPVTG